MEIADCSEEDCNRIRKKVLILSSVLFTVQALGFVGTMIFYWFAQSEQFRDEIAKPLITSLYHRYQWRWLRKEHALELHVLISGGVQLGLLVFSMMLLVGIARRLKCLLIPWLVIIGLTQIAILSSAVLCVVYLPGIFKLLSIGVVAGDAFFIFPWWFAVIHLAAIIGKKFDEDDHEAAFSNQYEATNTECSCGDNRSIQSRMEETCRTVSRCQSRIQSTRNFNSISDILSEL